MSMYDKDIMIVAGRRAGLAAAVRAVEAAMVSVIDVRPLNPFEARHSEPLRSPVIICDELEYFEPTFSISARPIVPDLLAFKKSDIEDVAKSFAYRANAYGSIVAFKVMKGKI